MLKTRAQWFIFCVCVRGAAGVEGFADGKTAEEKKLRYWQDTWMSVQLLPATTCGGRIVCLCGFMLFC